MDIIQEKLKEKIEGIYSEWLEVEKKYEIESNSIIDFEEKILYIEENYDNWSDILIKDLGDEIFISSENQSFLFSTSNIMRLKKENISVKLLSDENLIELLNVKKEMNINANDLEGLQIENGNLKLIITTLNFNLKEEDKINYIKLIYHFLNYRISR